VYLLLWRSFISTVLSFIGFKRVKKHDRKSTLLLKWENHSYDITFKEFSKGLEEATLRDLKQKCKLATGVPVAAMKLTVSGGKFACIARTHCTGKLLMYIFDSQYEG
jgi:hypothetical protein